jgi:predicted Zn-ribbon and HTH transcriptional regulator
MTLEKNTVDHQPAEASGTLRKRITSALQEGSMTMRELSKQLRASEKEILAHMDHVAKSLQPPQRLMIEPAACHKCGFIFSDRRRFSIPSRCPRCRHEGIQPPEFRITIV